MTAGNFSLIKLTLTALIFFLVGCDEELPTNALDQNSDLYSDVETTINSGPANNATITASTVTFTFSGNELVTEYSYHLDFATIESDWSEWTTDTTATFDRLDEGGHTFYVKGRYSVSDEDLTPAQSSFNVDAVSGSSIRIFPQVRHAILNSVFDMDVYAEEVVNVAGLRVEIQYDSQQVELYGDIVKGQFLTSYSGSDIFIDEVSTGSMIITSGVTAGNDDLGLNGSGILFKLSFNALISGVSNIDIITVEYRDADNNNIELNEVINGEIIVE